MGIMQSINNMVEAASDSFSAVVNTVGTAAKCGSSYMDNVSKKVSLANETDFARFKVANDTHLQEFAVEQTKVRAKLASEITKLKNKPEEAIFVELSKQLGLSA